MKRKKFWVVMACLLAAGAGAFAVSWPRTEEPASDVVTASIRLEVDLSARRLYVTEGGETTATYRIAVGKPSYPTPEGNFRIRRIVWNPRWVPPDSEWAKKKKPRAPGDPQNPMGKVKIFFSDPDYYIHGTREVDSLGQAESHGCIRMTNSDVIALARKVMSAGGKPVDSSWVRRVLNRLRSTREVRLSQPVAVAIRA